VGYCYTICSFVKRKKSINDFPNFQNLKSLNSFLVWNKLATVRETPCSRSDFCLFEFSVRFFAPHYKSGKVDERTLEINTKKNTRIDSHGPPPCSAVPILDTMFSEQPNTKLVEIMLNCGEATPKCGVAQNNKGVIFTSIFRTKLEKVSKRARNLFQCLV